VAALRGVGFDMTSYEAAYDRLHYATFNEVFTDLQFEPGYILVNIISPGFYFLVFTMATLTILLKYVVIMKLSPFPVISLLILYLSNFLNFEMGQIRQALAMSFVLLSVYYYSDKSKSLLFFLFAVLFHYSALIFVFAFFLPKKIKSLSFYVVLIGVAIGLYFIIEPLILTISNYVPGLAGAKLESYYEDEKGQVGISLPVLFLKIILLSLFYFQKSKIIESDKSVYQYIFNLYFFSLFLYVAFAFFPQISGRGGAYYGLFEIFVVPIILKKIDYVSVRVLLFLFLISIYSIIFIKFLGKWGEFFIPYKTSFGL